MECEWKNGRKQTLKEPAKMYRKCWLQFKRLFYHVTFLCLAFMLVKTACPKAGHLKNKLGSHDQQFRMDDNGTKSGKQRNVKILEHLVGGISEWRPDFDRSIIKKECLKCRINLTTYTQQLYSKSISPWIMMKKVGRTETEVALFQLMSLE